VIIELSGRAAVACRGWPGRQVRAHSEQLAERLLSAGDLPSVVEPGA
jgi:hypothetical protein